MEVTSSTLFPYLAWILNFVLQEFCSVSSQRRTRLWIKRGLGLSAPHETPAPPSAFRSADQPPFRITDGRTENFWTHGQTKKFRTENFRTDGTWGRWSIITMVDHHNGWSSWWLAIKASNSQRNPDPSKTSFQSRPSQAAQVRTPWTAPSLPALTNLSHLS